MKFNLKKYRMAAEKLEMSPKFEQKDYNAPYAVIYTGQQLEWYGNDEMTEGRYKDKGQGGRILAINIPTKEMAARVKEEMERKLFEPKNLLGTGINGRKGRDWFIVDYEGIFICSMSELGDFFDIDSDIECPSGIDVWAHPRLFVDYKGIEETPISESDLDTKGKEILELLG